MTFRTGSMAAVALAILILTPGLTLAQGASNRPVRMVLPYAAGGGGDLVARGLAARLTEGLGRPVVVDNRPGAGGELGVSVGAQAAPDGDTVLLVGNGPLAVAPNMHKVPYDPIKDLIPVQMVGGTTYVIAVNTAFPAASLADLVKIAKDTAKGVSYSTTGVGSTNHLAGELLKLRSGANLVPIAYTGAAPAATALLSGEVPVAISDLVSILPQSQDGKARILAVTNSRRSGLIPNVPTVAEQGYPGFAADTWTALFVPTGTPSDIVNRLSVEVGKAVRHPDMVSVLQKAGSEPILMANNELRQFVADQLKQWSEVIKAANLSAN